MKSKNTIDWMKRIYREFDIEIITIPNMKGDEVLRTTNKLVLEIVRLRKALIKKDNEKRRSRTT